MASIIASVEYVELTWDNTLDGATNLTKGQDETKCIPILSWRMAEGSVANDSRERNHAVDIYDNAGTAAVRIIRTGAADTSNRTTGVFIIEFVAAINVQKVAWSIATAVTSTNVTITDVTAQSSAFWMCTYDHDDTVVNIGYGTSCAGSRFNGASTTSITISRTNNNGPVAGWLYVVDCDSSEFIVDHQAISVATTEVSSTNTISSTVLADSFVLADYDSSENGDDPEEGVFIVDLQNATTVRARRTTGTSTPTSTATVYAQIVEAQGGEFSVQRGDETMVGVGEVATITAVTQANSVVKPGTHMSGQGCIGASDGTFGGVLDEMAVLCSFNTSTEIAFDRITATETDNIFAWEVIDFTATVGGIVPQAMHYRKQMGVS